MNRKEYSVREFQRILQENGFELLRQKGSHQIWNNGMTTLVLPAVALKPIIAQKLIKQGCLNI